MSSLCADLRHALVKGSIWFCKYTRRFGKGTGGCCDLVGRCGPAWSLPADLRTLGFDCLLAFKPQGLTGCWLTDPRV